MPSIRDLEKWAENAEKNAQSYKGFAENARSDANFRRSVARASSNDGDVKASVMQAEMAALSHTVHELYKRMTALSLQAAQHYDDMADELERKQGNHE